MPLRALLLFALHALLLVLGHWNHTNMCNHTRCAKAEGLRAGGGRAAALAVAA